MELMSVLVMFAHLVLSLNAKSALRPLALSVFQDLDIQVLLFPESVSLSSVIPRALWKQEYTQILLIPLIARPAQ